MTNQEKTERAFHAALDEVDRLKAENTALRDQVDALRSAPVVLQEKLQQCLELSMELESMTAERDALAAQVATCAALLRNECAGHAGRDGATCRCPLCRYVSDTAAAAAAHDAAIKAPLEARIAELAFVLESVINKCKCAYKATDPRESARKLIHDACAVIAEHDATTEQCIRRATMARAVELIRDAFRRETHPHEFDIVARLRAEMDEK